MNRKDVAKYEIFNEAKMKICAFFAFGLECPKMVIHRNWYYMHDGRILEANKIQNLNSLNNAQKGDRVDHLFKEDNPEPDELIMRK